MMKPTPTRLSRRWRIVAAIAMLASGTTWAAGAGEPTTAQQRYQQERARCLGGQSHQDQATCLKEARNALGDAQRGKLDKDQQPAFQRNALERCQALPAQDRADCVARVEGHGATTGSVEGGGVYKETTTVEIGTPPATEPATSNPAAPATPSGIATPPQQPTQ